MDEKDRRSNVRRSDEYPRKMRLDSLGAAPSRPLTLWRMRSATLDNQASCSVTEDDSGYDVLVVFAKGFGVPEHFDDVTSAMCHSMEIAGRLTAQGWSELDLSE